MAYQLRREQFVPRDLKQVASFFEDPRNLERLTPPFLGFTIMSEGPIEMKEGALIEYRIRLNGLPMRWLTRIEEYQPGKQFVDRQLQGPYRLWHHTHRFRAVPGGTIIEDCVKYRLPFGPLGKLVHTLYVERQLKKIFDYRTHCVTELFPPQVPPQGEASDAPPLDGVSVAQE